MPSGYLFIYPDSNQRQERAHTHGNRHFCVSGVSTAGRSRTNQLPTVVDGGGSERAAQVWLLCTDQLRKFKDSAAKHASDVSEAETRFLGTCAEVILTLKQHLETMPRLLGVLCEGLGREQIEAKAADQIEGTLRHAASDLASTIRGTSLETWLPPEMRGRRIVRPDTKG